MDLAGRVMTLTGNHVGVQTDAGIYLFVPLRTRSDGSLYIEQPTVQPPTEEKAA